MDGPPIVEIVNGHPHRYTTVTPCTHDWWHQPDLGYDPHYDEPIPLEHPAAQAALTRGVIDGQHQLWIRSDGRLGTPPPPDWTDPDA
jgi:hypothetical protein